MKAILSLLISFAFLSLGNAQTSNDVAKRIERIKTELENAKILPRPFEPVVSAHENADTAWRKAFFYPTIRKEEDGEVEDVNIQISIVYLKDKPTVFDRINFLENHQSRNGRWGKNYFYSVNKEGEIIKAFYNKAPGPFEETGEKVIEIDAESISESLKKPPAEILMKYKNRLKTTLDELDSWLSDKK